MNIPQSFSVRQIQYDDCKEWCLYKHYAHRMPCISYAFGLFDRELRMVGICTFGIPANPQLAVGAGQQDWPFYELNRLVVDGGLPRNALSFFVSQALGLLPRPMVIVSYADTEKNHHGYIYQATNWLYTGLSDRHIIYEVQGMEDKHQRHINDGTRKVGHRNDKQQALTEKYGTVKRMERPRKHRYFFFLGDRRQRRKMLASFKYETLPYPKGDNSRYDASYQCQPQGLLF